MKEMNLIEKQIKYQLISQDKSELLLAQEEVFLKLGVEGLNKMIREMGEEFDNDTYHASLGFSSSNFKKGKSGRFTLEEFMFNLLPKDEEKKESLELGTVVHSCFLEDKNLDDLIVREELIAEKASKKFKEEKGKESSSIRSTKIHKEMLAMFKHQTVVKEKDLKMIKNMLLKLNMDGKLKQLIQTKDTLIEKPFFFTCPYSGLLLRAKMDALVRNKEENKTILIDLKTSICNDEAFSMQAFNFEYPLSIAFYEIAINSFLNMKNEMSIFANIQKSLPSFFYKEIIRDNNPYLDMYRRILEGRLLKVGREIDSDDGGLFAPELPREREFQLKPWQSKILESELRRQ